MKGQGRNLSELIEEIVKYAYSGEINFRIENKLEAMEKLKSEFCNREQSTALYDFDGYRVEFEQWWFNVRPSNTEPYLRLVVEAETTDMLSEKLEEIKQVLNPYIQ
jgi:phosphomannomutase